MSSAQTKPERTEQGVGQRMIHRYPRDPRYRLSGMSPPQIGDIAWCGHVKRLPPIHGLPHATPPDCVVCAEFWANVGYR